MVETNEMQERNEESEEENQFPSGFGGIDLDTDSTAHIDSNINDQRIIAKENAKKQQKDNDTKQEMTDTTGRSII